VLESRRAGGRWLSAALILLPLPCATAYRIRVEEAALLEHFGREYADYARATKRRVPWIY
jgi:protein-S-isoprenylcysteine O-methyltransferase Ste14